MTDLVIRSIVAGEEPLVAALPDPAVVGRARFGQDYLGAALAGDYRPEWTWVAERGGVVVARAVWWGGAEDAEPRLLDWFDFTDAEAAVELLRTAPLRGEFELRLPPGWRQDPVARAAGEARIAVAERAGMRVLVERFRYRWTPACGLPERPGRLVFRPTPDEDAVLAAFRLIHQGSLDAHARLRIEEDGLEAAALEELEYLKWLPSSRERWLLAYTPGGELVGLTVPGHTPSDPVIGYIGVVPAQRGHGYAYDLLAEATHVHAEDGVDRVVAATDQTNTPMAATFARAGYPVEMERVDLV
ncbi:RimJ/RimL family protein N-acetyltransferase [Crossiella equi]|uniref:RimJ/RimL family protein N-acetyltransferase n=1 Tax=Crossiella equi TaxID=130796 RepID=A0ABS5A465_9PSEU|nr:GNAT family N-acetyltransferase [Crossiella equi]MBP2471366.1 RimJ/RimL family protein N-acetyltransferase [Crossiella equi]